MNFSIGKWIEDYSKAVKDTFGDRVWFIGLQGSYGRGEATEESDIDTVLILDKVSCDDLNLYSKLLDTLSNRDKACGFISGKAEVNAWDKSDLFQLCHDTTAIYGSLDELMDTISKEDVKRAIRIGACNIYHASVHNAVHEKSTDMLKNLYKSAAFTLQAIAYLKHGMFERKQENFSELLSGQDKIVLDKRLYIKKCGSVSDSEFALLSDLLIRWSSECILKCSA